MERVKIIECPRDAWQGGEKIIPTETKVAYLRQLIELGFRHLDAVSFVAPKYVPQMADSEEVMMAVASHMQQEGNRQPPAGATANAESRTPSPEIIGIVVNEQGLARALKTPGVTTIGYPYSVSAYFRRANANMSKEESQRLVEKLQHAVSSRPNGPGGNAVRRDLVVYISMAFGNPYGEPWGPEIVAEAVEWLKRVGVKTVSLADTVGKAGPKEVGDLFRAVKSSAEGLELGVHLHSRHEDAAEKVLAAYESGCRRFDSALTGLGGCPFAGDDLVGNIPTEIVVSTLHGKGATTGIEPWALLSAVEATEELRKEYAHH